ncbi:MAG: HDOD domain-containing protein [Archangium sp.]
MAQAATAEKAEAPAGAGESQTASRVAQAIEALVLKRVQDDTVPLPPLPTAIAACMKVANSADFEFKALLPHLELDPMLAARMMRSAKSAAAGPAGNFTTLGEALTRLGQKNVKASLQEAAAERLFQSRDAEIAKQSSLAWRHSVAVAMAARDLCALISRADGEEAYLAGLFHDIGKPVVAGMMLEAERQIVELRSRTWVGSKEWTWVLSRTHRKVGVALAEKWSLTAAITRCIRDCGEYDAADRSSLSNVVCFSNALVKAAGLGSGETDVEDAKALVMIGRSILGVDDALVNGLSANVRSRVERQV